MVSEERCRADLQAVKDQLEVEPAVGESELCAGGRGGDTCQVNRPVQTGSDQFRSDRI